MTHFRHIRSRCAYTLENAEECIKGESIARDYEPGGMVEAMDVFYCVPLAAVSSSKEEWLEEHLSKWKGFCRTEVRFCEVGGAHYTMIGPEHVGGFQKTLRLALKARGV